MAHTRWMLVAFLIANASLQSAFANNGGCELTDEPVCGEDGLEYTNECLARAQGVAIAIYGECDGSVELSELSGDYEESSEESSGWSGLLETFEESSPEESSPVELGPGVFVDRALRETEGLVTGISIGRYTSVGYRFVGLYQQRPGVPSFTFARAPAPADDRRPLSSDRPRGVGLNRNGNLYVQTRNLYTRSPYRYTPARLPAGAAFRRSLLQQQIGIIGSDDRELVTSRAFPATAAVSVVFQAGGDVGRCTASFISGNVLLTSAHCLYDDYGGYFFDFASYTFYTSAGKKLGALVDTALVTAQFIKGDQRYDVGLILLDRNFEDELGYLGTAPACSTSPVNVTLFGYPLDKSGDKLYKSSCTIQPRCDDVLLEHQCDDAPGMSGGPLLDLSDNIIKAVLLGAKDQETNTGVLLSPPIIGFIGETVDDFAKISAGLSAAPSV